MKKLILILSIICFCTVSVSAQQQPLNPQQKKYLLKMKQQKASPAKINAKRNVFINNNLIAKQKKDLAALKKAKALKEKQRKATAAKAKKDAELAAKKKANELKAAKAKQKKGTPLSKEEKKMLVDDNQKDMKIRSARSPQQQEALDNKNSGNNADAPVISGNQDKKDVNYGNGTKNSKSSTVVKPPVTPTPGTTPAAAPSQLKGSTTSPVKNNVSTTTDKAKKVSKEDKADRLTGEKDSKAKDEVDRQTRAESIPNLTTTERLWLKLTQSQKRDYDYIMSKPLLKQELKDQCKLEFSSENFNFLNAVKTQSRTASQKEFLYKVYISETGTSQINLGDLNQSTLDVLAVNNDYKNMNFTNASNEIKSVIKDTIGRMNARISVDINKKDALNKKK